MTESTDRVPAALADTNRTVGSDGPGRTLVLGAGELGHPVVRALAQRAAETDDTTVSILLRPDRLRDDNPTTAILRDELTALDIGIEAADIATATVEDLAEIFRRFDTVVSCVGFAAGERTQLKLARAALMARVKRHVPWQFGVDYDLIGRGSPQNLFDEQLDVRDLLRAQDDTEWIIISTGMFTSFLFEPSFGVVDLAADTVHALGGLDNAVTVTTPDDIGELTAEILFTQPPIPNQVVYLAGDTITYNELADVVERVLNTTVQREGWTVPQLMADLAADPTDNMKKYRAVFAQGRGVAWDKSTSFNAQHGIVTTTTEQWARANLASPDTPA
jgi:hypothetical protein